MKVARILVDSSPCLIASIDDDWFETPFSDLMDFFDTGESSLRAIAIDHDRRLEVAPEPAQFLAPIRRFRRDILCTGWNYPNHFEESKGLRGDQEVEKPEHPTFFTKGPDTALGPYQDVGIDPLMGDSWDYEAELALVIGSGGLSIPEELAMESIWGYMLANDVSHRELQRAHGGQWLKGKSLDRTMPLGPVVVTRDALDLSNVRLECVLNGHVVQSAMVSEMAFSIPRLIAELSSGMTLRPGDVLLTGTPAGVGNARTPQLFLHPGDRLITRGTGIGEMDNRIVESRLTSHAPLGADE